MGLPTAGIKMRRLELADLGTVPMMRLMIAPLISPVLKMLPSNVLSGGGYVFFFSSPSQTNLCMFILNGLLLDLFVCLGILIFLYLLCFILQLALWVSWKNEIWISFNLGKLRWLLGNESRAMILVSCGTACGYLTTILEWASGVWLKGKVERQRELFWQCSGTDIHCGKQEGWVPTPHSKIWERGTNPSMLRHLVCLLFGCLSERLSMHISTFQMYYWLGVWFAMLCIGSEGICNGRQTSNP